MFQDPGPAHSSENSCKMQIKITKQNNKYANKNKKEFDILQPCQHHLVQRTKLPETLTGIHPVILQ